MAFAYLDPAAPLDHVPSPNRSEGSPAGPRALLPQMTTARRQVDLLAIAQGFAVSAPGITEIQGRNQRSWVLLAVTDLFEAWAIGWPPGGKIELHDHGQSHGAVVVASGSLTETTIRATASGVALISTQYVEAGGHRRFGPGYVHDLINDGEAEAVSVHVYGPRLTTMSYYELDLRGRLDVVRAEDVPPIGPFDTTSEHDPS
jgi:NAD(P)H-dependent flavin oxidoreductase YrpB (nitropropane dioxygenase family)